METKTTEETKTIDIDEQVYMKNHQEEIKDIYKKRSLIKPVKTGIKPIDRILKRGIKQGTLTFLIAESNIGKTTFLNQITDYMAQEKPVLYISLENAKDDLWDKTITRISHALAKKDKKLYQAIKPEDLDTLEFTEKQVNSFNEAINQICGLQKRILDGQGLNPITRDNTSVNNVNGIRKTVEAFIEIKNTSPVLIIDNFNSLVAGDMTPQGQTIDEINGLSLQAIANDLGAVVIAVAPITKADAQKLQESPQKNILTKESIKDTVELAYMADMVLGLRNIEKQVNRNDENPNRIEFDILKARNGQTNETVEIKFDKKSLTFIE